MSGMSDNNAASTSAAAAHEDSHHPLEIMPSVHQVEAWEQKHLPRLQYETLDHAVYRWSLADWSWDRLEKRRQKLFSPEFSCGGHTWKLMLFLGGVVASDPGKVSIYLVCTSTSKESHPCAQMAFSMSNPNDPTTYLTYNSYHRFTPHDDDWGFTYFCSSERLRTESASGRAVLEDDHVVVSVFMRVVKDSTAGGVLWYNLGTGYCPRATTGLMNMHAPTFGVGCLNLAIQLLNLLAPFRLAVYSIPTNKDTKRPAVPYALQRLFYELQNSGMPVSQTDLIAAMGWSDAWLRRARWDVMDYIRPLVGSLEPHLVGTPHGAAVAELFYGESEAVLHGLGGSVVGDTTPFDALDIDVSGHSDVVKALRAARDPLDVCMASTSDLARHPEYALSTRLRTLPPVLVLNMRRWRWDAAGNTHAKCEDRCEFPPTLSLREFVCTPDTPSASEYVLHAVFSDDGQADGGAHSALMKPRPDAFWCKFDDQTIVPVEDGVLRDAFEGSSAAHALVYLRRSAAPAILGSLDEMVVPEHIRDLRGEWCTDVDDDAGVTVRLVGKNEFKRHMGFDIVSSADGLSFEARRDETLRDIMPRIKKLFKRVVQVRAMVKRHNRAVRPSKIIPFQGATLDMALRDIGTTYNNLMDDSYLLFYVEESPDMKREKPFDNSKRLIFLKHFDIPNESLRGVGAVYVNPTDQVAVIRERIRKIMRWRGSVDVEMLEEVMCDVPQHIDVRRTFLQSNFETGDIIAFNRRSASADADGSGGADGGSSKHPSPKYPTLLAMMRSFERPPA